MTSLQDSELALARVSDPALEIPGDLITQAELQRFHELRVHMREYDELRHRLREKVDRQALIELGKFSLRVERRSQKNFTFAKLAVILGEEQVFSLKEQLAPTHCVRMTVVETGED